MSEEETDVFNEIIKLNNLENLMSETELYSLNVAQLHEGVSSMTESMMYIMEFITRFFTAQAEGKEKPAMTKSMIINIKTMFEASEGFNEDVAESSDDDEEEDY